MRSQLHFTGIAGVGMSGLAQAARHCGHTVSGSDRLRERNPESSLLQKLQLNGCALFPQDGSGISEATGQVVVSSAIEDDNPDLKRARELGIPLIHRAKLLAELCAEKTVIAVSGTAGKSTVTGLLGWIFEQLGLDPTVYCGGALLNWKSASRIGNFRAGSSDYWIVEVDESDRSLLEFSPTHALITNIARDHFELAELKTIFRQFASQTKTNLICPPEFAERLASESRITAQVFPASPVPRNNPFHFRNATFQTPLFGFHNLQNTLNALELCSALELNLPKIAQALRSFQGIERRLERVGKSRGILVLDDYAHNPLKIEAALSSVAQNSQKLHAYWRPHGFGPLSEGMEGFKNSFSRSLRAGDKLYILPVYYAGGTVTRRVTAPQFVAYLQKSGIAAEFVESYAELSQRILQNSRAGETIIGMGARDPELPHFARRLVRELAEN